MQMTGSFCLPYTKLNQTSRICSYSGCRTSSLLMRFSASSVAFRKSVAFRMTFAALTLAAIFSSMSSSGSESSTVNGSFPLNLMAQINSARVYIADWQDWSVGQSLIKPIQFCSCSFVVMFKCSSSVSTACSCPLQLRRLRNGDLILRSGICFPLWSTFSVSPSLCGPISMTKLTLTGYWKMWQCTLLSKRLFY